MARTPLVFVAASLGTAAELELSTAVTIWKDAQEASAKAIDAERTLRASLIEKYFPGIGEGTHTGSMRENNLKCQMQYTRTVVQEQYAAARAWAEANPEKGKALIELMDLVFRCKMEVNVAEWKDLTDMQRRLLADMVTEKAGSPSLKLEPKK